MRTPGSRRPSRRRGRRTCSRPPKGAGDRGRSRLSVCRSSARVASRRTCSSPASGWRSGSGCAPARSSDVVVGIGIFNAEGTCCYGTNTHIDGAAAGELSATARPASSSTAWIWWTAPTSSMSPCTGNGAPYDYHRLLYTFRVTSRLQGSRHLPPAAQVDVLRRHAREGPVVRRARRRTCRPPARRPPSPSRSGRAAARSSSPMACSTCCIRAMSATCGCARAGRGVDRRGELRPIRAREQGSGPSDQPGAGARGILLALASVDAAVIFDEDTPHAIISRIQPDILVKGADWGEHNIVGRDVVEARGGRVVRVELSPGYSTTELIARPQASRTPGRWVALLDQSVMGQPCP